MRGSTKLDGPSGNPFSKELLTDAPCGFLVTDTNERALYCNATLGHWLGRDPSEIESGVALEDILTRASHLLFQTQIAPAIRLEGFARGVACMLSVKDRNEPLPVLLNAVFIPPNGDLPERINYAFFDASERVAFERRLRERQKESEELAVVVRNAKVGIVRCDRHGKIRRLNPAGAQILSVEEGNLPQNSIENLLPLDGAENWFSNAIERSEPDCTFEGCYRGNHYNISVGEISNPEEPYAEKDYSVILRNISKRVLAEQRTELLVGELNHRIKNIFSVVLGLISQSLRHAPVEREKLIHRIQSLARSHDILTQNYWKDADVRKIFEQIEEQAGDHQSVVIEGPDFRLPPHQFKALSMAVHELATNARKYGALRADHGRVEIMWSLSDSDARQFELIWRERGGPPVTAPEHTGFGSAMIERTLAAEFKGSAEVHFHPEGLEFRLRGTLTQ